MISWQWLIACSNSQCHGQELVEEIFYVLYYNILNISKINLRVVPPIHYIVYKKKVTEGGYRDHSHVYKFIMNYIISLKIVWIVVYILSFCQENILILIFIEKNKKISKIFWNLL